MESMEGMALLEGNLSFVVCGTHVCFVLQTLYKTQVRELKEECEEKNKLYKDVQQSLQEQQEER